MRIAIITGASSGMGKEFVKLLMREKLNLDEVWVLARRKSRLMHWPKLYREQKFRILPVDLSNQNHMKIFEKILKRKNPQVEVLIHCAGFGIMGDICEISKDQQMEMVDINCKSVVEISSLVLPYLGNQARLIYLASAAAFLPQPGFAVYAASKAFVLSYVRALRAELRKQGSGASVTVVCPGAVKTEFFQRASEYKTMPAYKKLVMADPKKVVEKAWRDSKAGKEVSVYGCPMKLFRLATKILPHSLFLKWI